MRTIELGRDGLPDEFVDVVEEILPALGFDRAGVDGFLARVGPEVEWDAFGNIVALHVIETAGGAGVCRRRGGEAGVTGIHFAGAVGRAIHDRRGGAAVYPGGGCDARGIDHDRGGCAVTGGVFLGNVAGSGV